MWNYLIWSIFVFLNNVSVIVYTCKNQFLHQFSFEEAVQCTAGNLQKANWMLKCELLHLLLYTTYVIYLTGYAKQIQQADISSFLSSLCTGWGASTTGLSHTLWQVFTTRLFNIKQIKSTVRSTFKSKRFQLKKWLVMGFCNFYSPKTIFHKTLSCAKLLNKDPNSKIVLFSLWAGPQKVLTITFLLAKPKRLYSICVSHRAGCGVPNTTRPHRK